tara:strand:- start:2430 stop:2612 length:183 start_codon:yes stop_codon:yes gene_type:complete
MIKIEKNENCLGFFNVFAFGRFVDQVQGRAKALHIAKSLAQENQETHIINHKNQIISSKS